MITVENASIFTIRDYLMSVVAYCSALNNTQGNENIWGMAYNLIFSPNFSRKIFNRFPDFKYADPDCDYEDDVRAFADGFNEYVCNKMGKPFTPLLGFDVFANL